MCRDGMHRAVSVSVRANGYRATLDPPCAVLLPVPVTCARVPARVAACASCVCVYAVCLPVRVVAWRPRVCECRRGHGRRRRRALRCHARHCTSLRDTRHGDATAIRAHYVWLARSILRTHILVHSLTRRRVYMRGRVGGGGESARASEQGREKDIG